MFGLVWFIIAVGFWQIRSHFFQSGFTHSSNQLVGGSSFVLSVGCILHGSEVSTAGCETLILMTGGLESAERSARDGGFGATTSLLGSLIVSPVTTDRSMQSVRRTSLNSSSWVSPRVSLIGFEISLELLCVAALNP